MGTESTPLAVVVVTAPACHLCDDALQRLRAVAGPADLALRVVELESEEGRDLVARHRPPMSPLVLVDGEFFSSGRLPQRKVEALVRARVEVARDGDMWAAADRRVSSHG
ncbi:glutaredoxin [Cellulomonas sp. NTE-D12]|uniref:glutaredoxin n=1 Tax=Cellulomonas sp. NTE-D12 TaxID=2962632 RepID=UPI003081D483|nr:hypothetical protein CELD12_17660 [Cellulomonas sp. NTE-D12]